MFYIYIIYSESTDKYYIGHTNNIDRRVIEHNANPHMSYTHKFRPWKLIVYFAVNEDRGDTMKIEKFIKKQKSRIVIEKLIDTPNYFSEIAQLVRVPIDRD